MKIYSLGHSTRSQEEFLALLEEFHIKTLVDVINYPGSRYVSWFNKEKMEVWLKEAGINYLHLRELGGRRRASLESLEPLVQGWTSEAFRN